MKKEILYGSITVVAIVTIAKCIKDVLVVRQSVKAAEAAASIIAKSQTEKQ